MHLSTDNVEKEFMFMKKALRLVLMYFLLLIFGTALGVVFYSLYLSLQNFVVGNEIIFFDKHNLINVAFVIGECMLLFICPLLIYLRISNKGGVGQFIAFVFLALLTWGIAYPSVIYYEGKVSYKIETKNENLSGGYFREAGDKVYYFTTDYNGNPYVDTTTVIIDKSEKGTVEIEELKYTPDFILYKNSAPYRDILIKNSFESNVSFKILDFSVIKQNAALAMAKGWTFWLGFLSLGLIICSLYGAAVMFNWRLINTTFLVFSTACILFVNSNYYNPVFQSFISPYIDNNKFFIFLSKYIDAPLLVLVNVLFSLIFIVVGIVRFAARKKKSY